jgi:ribonuclease HI
MMSNLHKLYVDGSSLNNPGHSGAGFVIIDPINKIIKKTGIYLGSNKTNNEAEYNGLIYGVSELHKLDIKRVSIFMDSKLVVNQIQGKFSVKASNLLNLFNNVITLLNQLEYYEIKHLYREENTLADDVAHRAALTRKNIYE